MTTPASNRTDHDRTALIDIAMAVVLSLATLASAWCGYQSSLWGGAETYRLVNAFQAGRTVSDKTLEANQRRAFDASMFIEYVTARTEGSAELENFLYSRFRPEMRRAVDAWLETDPFNDPGAPPHPFQPDWYELPEEREASRQQERGARAFALAQEIDQISDTYVLLTVLFASILFFAGMAGTFNSSRIEVTFGVIAVVLFVAVLSYMLTMPRCKDCDLEDPNAVGAAPGWHASLYSLTPPPSVKSARRRTARR